ncbi:general secretion pathway protein GspB [Catenovulum maritimum]|uniref:Type II secretion system protein GspB C-terminal domain-containing protein n=1 Tax=Catenovulum maritimum TaxID=1513271 RepID=A0A0J8GUN0_9ALTE|nr:general secretion pathway protein GspB [Catenovulum maritimum]KMT66457.1 hypothetical protein XM47_02625 [Catenovulum maritimum]
MSYLLEALKKSENNTLIEKEQSASLYAQDTKADFIYRQFKIWPLVFIFTGLVFYSGYYFAIKSVSDATQINSLAVAAPVPENSNLSLDNKTSKDKAPLVSSQETIPNKLKTERGIKVEAFSISDMSIAKLQKTKKKEAVTAVESIKSTVTNSNPVSEVEEALSLDDNEKSQSSNFVVAVKTKDTEDEATNSQNDARIIESPVSDDLLKKFALAMEQTMALSDEEISHKVHSQVKPLAEHPYEFQKLIPRLEFQTHIYSSDPNQRWIKVNGKVLNEGETFESGLKLIKIEPQSIVLSYQTKLFSLEALSNW